MAISQMPAHLADEDDDEQRSLEWRGLLHELLRWSWLILLCALLAGLAAWLYVRQMPTLYRSTAVIEIQSRNDRAFDLKGDNDELKDPEVVETTIQNFRHRALMERVAKALDLANDPAFLGFVPGRSLAADFITDRLLAGSSASRRPGTRLVDVTFVHPDSLTARKITNALVYQFIEQGKEERTGVLQEQTNRLTGKYKELTDTLAKSEKKLQDYKREKLSTGSESVSVEDRRNFVEDKLKELNGDLLVTSGERLGMESDREAIRTAGANASRLRGIASILLDPQVAAAQQQFAKAKDDLSALLGRYGEKWPRVIEQRAVVRSAEAALDQAAIGAPARLESRYQAAFAKEKSLQEAVATQQTALLSLQEKLFGYRELQREFESNRALADSVLQRLKESTLALGGAGDQAGQNADKSGNFHVVEPAVAAVSLANRRLFIVAGAAVGGAILIAGIFAGLYFLNSTIRTVDAAERLLGLPVLATFPILRKVRQAGDLLVSIRQPNTPAAEGFRTLRCALSLLGPRNERRVFLFTSAVPGEGKSFTAANTAIAFAQQGYKTLLVEADLRKPSLAKALLGMDKQPPGMGDYMAGQPAPITKTDIPKLSLLTAGAYTAAPAELLSSAEFEELVVWMKENFDRVVIDTAPVNVVSDTLGIVGCASVICLVVRGNATPQKTVQRAIELLRRSGVRPDGLVLNAMPRWNGVNNHYDYASRAPYGNAQTYGHAYAGNGADPGGGSAPLAR